MEYFNIVEIISLNGSCLDWRRAQTGQTSKGQAGTRAGTGKAGQEQAGRTDPGRK